MRSLYLVRHGPAAPREDFARDEDRPLTEEGIEKTRLAARGFATLAQVDLVLTSPLIRARQTADLLVEALQPRPKLEELGHLAFGGQAAKVADAVNAIDAARVALVGHEPDMGELVGWLISGRRDVDVDFKKAAACRIDFDTDVKAGLGCLVWFCPPAVLRALGG